MDLFDIRKRLGASRSYSVRDKSTVLNVLIHLSNFKSGCGPMLLDVTTERRSNTLKSFELFHKSGNMQSPQSSTTV